MRSIREAFGRFRGLCNREILPSEQVEAATLGLFVGSVLGLLLRQH